MDITYCLLNTDDSSRTKMTPAFRDWSLITGGGGGGGGATKWENRGSETFCAPPQDRVNLLSPPPYTEWKLFVPPLQYG